MVMFCLPFVVILCEVLHLISEKRIESVGDFWLGHTDDTDFWSYWLMFEVTDADVGVNLVVCL